MSGTYFAVIEVKCSDVTLSNYRELGESGVGGNAGTPMLKRNFFYHNPTGDTVCTSCGAAVKFLDSNGYAQSLEGASCTTKSA